MRISLWPGPALRGASWVIKKGDGIYNLLTDKDFTLYALHKKYRQWNIDVTDAIVLKLPDAELILGAYGRPQLNGAELQIGRATTLPSQTQFSWDGKTLNVAKGDSAEYNVSFSIVTAKHKHIAGTRIKYINTNIFTKSKGVASDGVMPTGILGEGFDADSTVRTALKQALVAYKRQNLHLLVDAPAATPTTQAKAEIEPLTALELDPVVTLAVSPIEVAEDDGTHLAFTCSRSGDTTKPLTVNAIMGGTAKRGIDYKDVLQFDRSKTIRFAAGSATARLRFAPIADSTSESDETVVIQLLASNGYTLGTIAPVIGTIRNDDVSSSSTTTLEPGQSSLRLLGDQPINGIGNQGNNTLIGNSRNNRLVGLLGADVLTGGGRTDNDVFVYSSLQDSLLGAGQAFDRITDFHRNDRLSAPPPVDAARLTSSLGRVSALTEAAIATLLTTTTFQARAVAAFTASGQRGTFIAMNDERPGFQADGDALVFLQNHRISSANGVAVV
ncbi:MAG: bluetail domain-containing putative surface protein [Cyanobacteriota bacterium]|nr:bluetail domain-containing putative surface protein [Cyanobacteriota bacterium]